MLTVGLTGGIGAGKSAVAGMLAEHGAAVVDADQLAREVVEPGTPGLARIVAEFGPGMLTDGGALDRAALGAVVFDDPDRRAALNAIVHPLVAERTAELVADLPEDAVAVHDVPLLAENHLAPGYHLVLVVTAAEETRLRRLAGRGLPAEDARARMAAQATDDERRAVADVVLDNDGSLEHLRAQVDRVWERIAGYAANLAAGRPAPRDGVRVVEYDPSWPALAGRLADRIRAATGGRHRVDHIGSTAVPGLAAKDVIDLQLAVPDLAAADGLAPALAAAGFVRRPADRDHVPPGRKPGSGWAKRLHASADPARPVNLHVRVEGAPNFRYALLFRDHLRAHPAAAAAYGELKRGLAALTPDDVDAYTSVKDPACDLVALAAEDWAARTGWRP
ncbi:MAG: dephospho-CoA kinase [Mycobacteriales bacterium]